MSLEKAIEDIYTAVNSDNEDLDLRIAALKAALTAAGQKDVTFDPSRMTHNNREGRKLMQAYFRKKGIAVKFKEKTAP